MQNVNASIITIGDELLIGQTIDTNSAWMAQELNKIGVWVRRRVAVGDVWDDIWNALDAENKESDIILITGGLGPTADDITKPLLCKYFGGKMVVNEKALEHVKDIFTRLNRPLLERNLKQAEVPDVCTVLHNARGTAPGMWFSPRRRNLTSPSPSKGGVLEPDSTKRHYWYQTSDPVTHSLLKNFVKAHKENPTPAESILWRMLRGKQLAGFKFRRQHIIRSFIADFICIPKRLIIEVDGLIHHSPENKLSDAARTIELNLAGFEVLRFKNEEIINDTDNVLNKILASLQKSNIEQSESENPPLEGREAFPQGLREARPIFISLPGVPNEMKGLMISEVLPRLQKEFILPAIVHKTIFTAGQGESFIAERIKDIEASLPSHIKLAYLPAYGMVRLRLTSRGDDKKKVEEELLTYFNKIKELVKDVLVADTDEGLEIVIGKILKAKGKTMATAESCTGGYIAHLITSIPGSSAYFNGSVVSYANQVKENVLGVSAETLKTVGAVSEETVTQMVKGVIEKLNVDFAVATSGIMGPDGGTPEKPVGTVWIAAGNKENVVTQKLFFRFDRERNIEMTAQAALNMLRKFILANS